MLITITGLFPSGQIARMAFDDLIEAGVPPADVSIVTNEGQVAVVDRSVSETAESAGTGASIGGVLGGTGGLLAGLGVIAIPGLGPVVAAGWLAAMAAGVVAGAAAGGLVGTLVELGISRDDAEFYIDGVQDGGTLLTIRVDETHADEVRAILDTHKPIYHGHEPDGIAARADATARTTSDVTGTSTPVAREIGDEERFISAPLH